MRANPGLAFQVEKSKEEVGLDPRKGRQWDMHDEMAAV
jgi:hypothetical protein